MGILDADEAEALWARIWDTLVQLAQDQQAHQVEADPVHRFLKLLRSALASGDAHIATRGGRAPESPEAWGWRRRPGALTSGDDSAYDPQGIRIGWVDNAGVYLNADAALKAANRQSVDTEALSLTEKTLGNRLHEANYLASIDKTRDRYVVRKTCEDVRQPVLHLKAPALFRQSEAQKAHDAEDSD